MKEETQSTKDLTPVEWLAMELRHCIEINNIPISPKLLNILEEQAKEMEKEQQQGYSEQEMLEFSEWVSHNDWVYLPSKSYWVNEEQEELEENFTTKELFEQFKQQEQ
jgi:hypothetical protein